MPCSHHWLIPHGGKVVTGECKLCHEKREFQNIVSDKELARSYPKIHREKIKYYQDVVMPYENKKVIL